MELERKLSSSLELPADMSLSPQWKFAPAGNKTNQLQPAAEELPKSALIGDWPVSSHAAAAPLFPVGPGPKKAGLGPGVTGKGGAAAAWPAPAGLGGPGRWREDERDNPAQRNNERWGIPGDDNAVKWGVLPEAPRISAHLGGAERWAAQVPAADGAGRGRGRPEDRWAPNRERDAWALPGMGDPADATGHSKRPVVPERWGGEGAPDAVKSVVDRWRSPGAVAAAAVPLVAGPPEAAAATGAGRGRGFTVGRGRGLKVGAVPGAPGALGAPASERWEGPGYQKLAADERQPGGPGGPEPSGGARRYSPHTLDHIRKQAVAATGGQLPTPPAVFNAALDYPEILPGDPLPEVPASELIPVKRWQGTALSRGSSLHPNGLDDDAAGRPLVPPQAFSYDQWLYKDPQGVIQGPFTKMDILDWQTAGFFPNDLPIKSAVDPDAPFIPLSAMIKMWDKIDHGSAPPGFAPSGLPPLQQQQQQEAGLGGFHGAPLSQLPAQQSSRPSIIELLGKKLQEAPSPSDPSASFGSQVDVSSGHHPGSDAQAPGNQGRGGSSIVSPYDQVQVMDGGDASKGLFGVSPLGLTGVLSPWGLGPTPAAPASSYATWLPPPTTAPPPQHHAAPIMQQSRQQHPGGQVGLFGGDHLLGRSPHGPADQQGGSAGVWDFNPAAMPGAPPTFKGWGAPQPPTASPDLQLQQQQQLQQQHLQQQHLQQQQQKQLQHLQQQQQQMQQLQHQHQIQQQQQQDLQDNQFAAPPVDHIAKLAQSMGALGMQNLQQGSQAQQQQQQQQQQHAWAAQPISTMLSGMKSLADIQQEQASEAARQAAAAQAREVQEQPQSAAPAETPVPAPPRATAAQQPDLSHLPSPLQQLFAAARAGQPGSRQPPQQQPDQPAQPPAGSRQQAEVSAQVKASRAEISRTDPVEQPGAVDVASAEAAPKPEPKIAPWAAVTAKAPVSKTLREIQEEEAARGAAEAQRAAQEQVAGVLPAPPQATTAAASAWSRVAAAGAAPSAVASSGAWGSGVPPASSARTPLNKVVQDEEQRPKASGRQAAPAAPPVRGATLGEILERQLNPNPTPRAAAWGGAAAPSVKGGSVNMREIMMFEESAADLEGGDMDEDFSDMLPQQAMVQPQRAAPVGAAPWAGPQPPAKTLKEIQEEEEKAERQRLQQQQQQQRPQPAPAAAKEEDLLWDYGGPTAPSPSASAAPPPPPPTRAPPGMFAAAAAKNVPIAALPAAAPKGAWLNAAGPATAAAKGAAGPAAGRANGAAAAQPARPAAAAAPRPAQPPQQQQQQQQQADLDDGSTIMFRDAPVSNEFQDWCRDQLKRLMSTEDLTMIEVLLSLDSRSEVAETCQVYMGNRPGVGGFVAEFLKRKDAELLLRQQGASKKKKGGNQGNPVSAANVVKAGGAKGRAK